jgi:hypothetical protein
MKDTEIAYEILKNFTYNGDQLLFELEVGKISDVKFRLGLLFELYGKSEGYEVDKDKIVSILKLQSVDVSSLSNSEILEYQKYFIEKMKPFMDSKINAGPKKDDLYQCLEFFTWLRDFPGSENLIWSESEEASSRIKSFTPGSLELVKSILLQKEHFEELVQIEKIISTN